MIFKLNFSLFLLIMATTNATTLSTTTFTLETSINKTTVLETISPSPLDCTNSNSSCPFPLKNIVEKQYYLGILNKVNWYKAFQFCRFHGMHLISITSQTESDNIEKHLNEFAIGYKQFWTSGTDLGEENNYFWMSNGQPIVYTNWFPKEPNSYTTKENCLELMNKDDKGFKWNDRDCTKKLHFICEVK